MTFFPVAPPPKASESGPAGLGLGETGQLLPQRSGWGAGKGVPTPGLGGTEEGRVPRGGPPPPHQVSGVETGWRIPRRPGRARIPEQGPGELLGAGEEGGAGEPRGQGGGGGPVTTKLGRGNYNPAVAPAYRATSDPSKRVAWEFRRRQRPVGEARGAATTASAPLSAKGGRRRCAAGGGGSGWREPGEAAAGLGPHPRGLALHPWEPTAAQPRGPALLHPGRQSTWFPSFATILPSTTRALWQSWGPGLGFGSPVAPAVLCPGALLVVLRGARRRRRGGVSPLPFPSRQEHGGAPHLCRTPRGAGRTRARE